MNVALLNPPWTDPAHPERWGIRAGSRWPHFQRRPGPGALPRYLPFPFFLAIAARACQDRGHRVLLVDAVAEDMDSSSLLDRLADFGPDLVFCESSTPSLANDLAFLRAVRQRLPRAKLACGGTHPPALIPNLLRSQGLPDFWLAGEYDWSVAALADALASGAGLDAVPGLITTRQTASPASAEDVDALPAPLFEQLPMTRYADPVCGLPAPGAQSWLSRGCPFRCSFCVWPQVIYGNRRYRPRRLEAALDEVGLLINTYGCESFYFDDDTANLGESRMIEMSRLLRERGLDAWPWSMMARADVMTPASLEALAGAGLYSIKYGVESISPKLLNACDKQTDLDKLSDIIRRTRSAGVKLHLTFTFGVPGETVDTMRQTLAFALEIAPETAQFSLCTPFPGTIFYEECRRNGWLTTEDWSQFLGSDEPVVETPWLKASELKAEYERAVHTWQDFCRRRLETRRQRLADALRRAVAGGRRWRLLGDDAFAAFLLQDPALNPTRAAAAEPEALPVIVSAHDEEKLLRRLLRQAPTRARQALRLFGTG
jgi:radical SAM superfamily enzyme YgiQ (UPF0313 family)